MAGEALVVVSLQSITGQAKDAVVTDFPVRITVGTIADAMPFVKAGIEGFYNDVHAAIDDLAGYISPEIDRTANVHEIRLYDLVGHLDGSDHGSPVAMDTFSLDVADDTTGLPSEVAAVITTRATGWRTAPVESGGTRPKSRLTGRNYIGPFGASVLSTTEPSRPSSNLQSVLLGAAYDLYQEWFSTDVVWEVWSRANASMTQLESVQVDNSWDTQRRRGVAPTFRNTLDV